MAIGLVDIGLNKMENIEEIKAVCNKVLNNLIKETLDKSDIYTSEFISNDRWFGYAPHSLNNMHIFTIKCFNKNNTVKILFTHDETLYEYDVSEYSLAFDKFLELTIHCCFQKPH